MDRHILACGPALGSGPRDRSRFAAPADAAAVDTDYTLWHDLVADKGTDRILCICSPFGTSGFCSGMCCGAKGESCVVDFDSPNNITQCCAAQQHPPIVVADLYRSVCQNAHVAGRHGFDPGDASATAVASQAPSCSHFEDSSGIGALCRRRGLSRFLRWGVLLRDVFYPTKRDDHLL